MTATALQMARRMNARALEPDTDGGRWHADVGPEFCERCDAYIPPRVPCVTCDAGAGVIALCLPCAERDAESAGA